MGEHALRTYQRIAPFYDLIDLPFELARYRSLRPLLFTGLSGRILDAGVGTGRNIAYYPPGSDVTGIDFSAAMLKRAARRRPHPTTTLSLLRMDLTQLEFADESFDGAVASFVFCTMAPDTRRTALRELSRVMKPGAPVILVEYAPATSALRRGLAKAWQPWVSWAFGAKLDQDLEPELPGGGLAVTHSRYLTANIKLIETRSLK